MSGSNWRKRDLPPVGIVRITPGIGEEALRSYRKCYMGISLDNPVFKGDSLESLVGWAVERFDGCLVVVGDYLRRHNEYILTGSGEEEAVAASLSAGDSFIESSREIFAKAAPGRLESVRWRDCMALEEYSQNRSQLERLYVSDGGFEAALRKDAGAFIERQVRNGRRLKVPHDEAVSVSCQYLLEEMAVFSALSGRGWQVELYPGPELTVLVKAARGAFEGLPEGLKRRINVELKVGGGGVEAQ